MFAVEVITKPNALLPPVHRMRIINRRRRGLLTLKSQAVSFAFLLPFIVDHVEHSQQSRHYILGQNLKDCQLHTFSVAAVIRHYSLV